MHTLGQECLGERRWSIVLLGGGQNRSLQMGNNEAIQHSLNFIVCNNNAYKILFVETATNGIFFKFLKCPCQIILFPNDKTSEKSQCPIK